MAFLIRLKGNWLKDSTLLSDPKMMVTKEWKSCSKKTAEIKKKADWFEFKSFEPKKELLTEERKPIEKVVKKVSAKKTTVKKRK